MNGKGSSPWWSGGECFAEFLDHACQTPNAEARCRGHQGRPQPMCFWGLDRLLDRGDGQVGRSEGKPALAGDVPPVRLDLGEEDEVMHHHLRAEPNQQQVDAHELAVNRIVGVGVPGRQDVAQHLQRRSPLFPPLVDAA